MRVEEVMTKEVSFCGPGTNAAAAAEIMWNRDCGILPVLGDADKLVGVVTDRDLFIALGTQNRSAADLSLGPIMQREPSSCSPEDDVRKALKTMAQNRVHRLPVVDESGALKGILSMNDVILQAGSETNGVLKDDVIRTLKAICEHSPRKSTPEESQQAKPATA
jgi:CBS domain-containing protein